MEKVLQPLNEKAATIIAEHIDLLDAQHVVPELLQLVAHVSAMRVIIHRCAASILNQTVGIVATSKMGSQGH